MNGQLEKASKMSDINLKLENIMTISYIKYHSMIVRVMVIMIVTMIVIVHDSENDNDNDSDSVRPALTDK